jgi:hypothetical protein
VRKKSPHNFYKEPMIGERFLDDIRNVRKALLKDGLEQMISSRRFPNPHSPLKPRLEYPKCLEFLV